MVHINWTHGTYLLDTWYIFQNAKSLENTGVMALLKIPNIFNIFSIMIIFFKKEDFTEKEMQK